MAAPSATAPGFCASLSSWICVEFESKLLCGVIFASMESEQLPPYLRGDRDSAFLSVKVQPRASANSIEGALGKELRIKIAALPVDSAANDALIRFLADCLDIPRSRIEILRGGASRHKLIRIYGMSVELAAQKLQQKQP
jgi:uncharacterized protein (TIGR00251 family)